MMRAEGHNRLLSITRNIIPYVKELNKVTGSVTASILMQQLEYWFDKKADGFYKFAEPCANAAYVDGDSWTEELGFTIDEYKGALKKICISYKSLSEWRNAEDKFQGKLYASYYERLSHKTFFLRNHALIDKSLDNVCYSTQSRESEKLSFGKQEIHVSRTMDFPVTEQGNSRFQYTDTTTEITTDNNITNVILTAAPVDKFSAPAIRKQTAQKASANLESLCIGDIQDWLIEKRQQGQYIHVDEYLVLERFKDYCYSKGKKYKDYKAALRNSFAWESNQPKLQTVSKGEQYADSIRRIQQSALEDFANGNSLKQLLDGNFDRGR